jgi:hypothetical protein
VRESDQNTSAITVGRLDGLYLHYYIGDGLILPVHVTLRHDME